MKLNEYDFLYEDRRRKKLRLQHGRFGRAAQEDWTFRCANCRQLVSTDPLLAGANNRNHCPYCLWSRHLDLHAAGDRLCACKSPMQPIGLTVKQQRKKYGSSGELMVVHRCTGCGKLSINRIAADDDGDQLYTIFKDSAGLSQQEKAEIEDSGIHLLTEADTPLVRRRLFGWSDPEVSSAQSAHQTVESSGANTPELDFYLPDPFIRLSLFRKPGRLYRKGVLFGCRRMDTQTSLCRMKLNASVSGRAASRSNNPE